MLKEFAVVRVRSLARPEADYDDWAVNTRPPRTGDTGTIVEVLSAPNLPLRYVVQCVDQDGMTLWLSDFESAEIEPFVDGKPLMGSQ